jgi:hypothetical protein
MGDTPNDQDQLTEEEIEKRRDEIARRMLNTPPTPHGSKSETPPSQPNGNRATESNE